jgi:hypothetical protein
MGILFLPFFALFLFCRFFSGSSQSISFWLFLPLSIHFFYLINATAAPVLETVDFIKEPQKQGSHESISLEQTIPGGSPLQNGLLAFYSFDGDATDGSGNGRHGTLHGAVSTANRFDQANMALYFDGITTSAYVDLGSSATWVLNSAFTISLWFKSDLTVSRSFCFNGQSGAGQSWEIMISTNSKLTFEKWGQSGLWIETSVISANTWYHVAIQVGTDNTGYIYVNGALAAQKLSGPNFNLPNSSDFLIGIPGDGGTAFQGSIDDVFVYNRVLSASEILELYRFDNPTAQPTWQPSPQPSPQPTPQPTWQPTWQPTRQPTWQPSGQPSSRPSCQPSSRPSSHPSSQPTKRPSSQPTRRPSAQPTSTPSSQPTSSPSAQPSKRPSSQPTRRPSAQPTSTPSSQPTGQPSSRPTRQPSNNPTEQPSRVPTNQPSSAPSARPSRQPSALPSSQPTSRPSSQPSARPTRQPSVQPSRKPSSQPSSQPSVQPSIQPSSIPSSQPSVQPSSIPTVQPSNQPTGQPSSQPTAQPSTKPSRQPTSQPSGRPSSQPSAFPTDQPTAQPSSKPNRQPTAQPSSFPSICPTSQPSSRPSGRPSNQPSAVPSTQPTENPSSVPSRFPSSQPSTLPTCQPSSVPTNQPTSLPTSQPSEQPSSRPSSFPSSQPTSFPTVCPSTQPTNQPTGIPSSFPSAQPSAWPTSQPTSLPTNRPTRQPSCSPSQQPSSLPTCQPSSLPSGQPTRRPSVQPSARPSAFPSVQPTAVPSGQPTEIPSSQPSSFPTRQPTTNPTSQPSSSPTAQPSSCPSSVPSVQPSSFPTTFPSSFPSSQPTSLPSTLPSSQPTVVPSSQPSRQPSAQPTSLPFSFPSSQPTSQPSPCPSNVPSIQPSSSPSRQPYSAPSSHPSTQPTTIPTVQPFAYPTFAPVAVIYESKGVLFYPGNPLYTNIPTNHSFLGISYILFGRNFNHESRFPSVIPLSSSAAFVSVINDDSGGIQSDITTRSTTVIGDINGDGFHELMVGYPLESRCDIYLGNSFQAEFVLTDVSIELVGDLEKGGGQLGWASIRAGDLNHDGLEEIMVSAIYANIVYVLYGKPEFPRLMNVNSDLTAKDGFIIIGSEKDTNFGVALALVHDFNKDQFQDIAISAIQSSGNQNVIYLLLGNSGFGKSGIIRIDQLIGSSSVSLLKIVAPVNSFAGYSLAGIGDINNDGYNDLAVGSVPSSSRNEQATYLIYGKTVTRNELVLNRMTKDEGFIITGGGFLVQGVGDVNNDGVTDVMITSYSGWKGKGNAYLITYPTFASHSPTVQPSSLPSSIPSFSPSTEAEHRFSSSSNSSHINHNNTAINSTLSPSRTPTVRLTSLPTLSPSSASPTVKPTLSPTMIPTLTKTAAPVISSLPTTRLPTIRPTTRRFSSSLTTSPSPSSPSSFTQSLSPTMDESIVTHITCSEAGSCQGEETGNNQFLISATSGTIKITGNSNVNGFDNTRNIYIIAPPSAPTENLFIFIKHFNVSLDIIDLSHLSEIGFEYLTIEEISFSREYQSTLSSVL